MVIYIVFLHNVARQNYQSRPMFHGVIHKITLAQFLQRVSIACYAERCISYSKSVRLSITRWH